jgi:hypothetical protein
MNRLATVFLIASVLVACGSETGDDAAAAASSSSSSSSGGSPECGVPQGPPTGSCNADDECSFSDGGCGFDSYCKDGSWAFVRACNNNTSQGCPREGLMAGSPCTGEGAQCLYNEGGACVADLECKGGVWVDSGC